MGAAHSTICPAALDIFDGPIGIAETNYPRDLRLRGAIHSFLGTPGTPHLTMKD